MRYKNFQKKIITGFIMICSISSVIGCFGKESLSNSSSTEQEPTELPISERPTPTAQEAMESMLGITLPEDALIEYYIHKWIEPVERIIIQLFSLKATINKADFNDFEQQIITSFGEARTDYSRDIISEDTKITHPFINRSSSGLENISWDNVERIYFSYRTGVPLEQEHKPFVTRYVYAFVMSEEDGKRVIYFSYGT